MKGKIPTKKNGRRLTYSNLSYTKRKASDSDTSATDDSIHHPENEQKEEKSITPKTSQPTQSLPPQTQSEVQIPQPPQKLQVLDNNGADKPHPVPTKTPNEGENENKGEEMKKRRAEYSLEVGISNNSSSPGSTYKRERPKRFSIKRKSVINPVDLTASTTTSPAAASSSTAAAAKTPSSEAEKKKKSSKKSEKDEGKSTKKDKNKKKKSSGDNKKKHTKSAVNTPFRMIHDVIRSSFKRKIVPACSKAPNVLHVFKTALDRYQNILFYEVTSQPKITSQKEEEATVKQQKMPSSQSKKITNNSNISTTTAATATTTISNNEKIQLLQNGIESYKKEIKQWEDLIHNYNIGNNTTENNKNKDINNMESKRDVSMLLPPFKERAGYNIDMIDNYYDDDNSSNNNIISNINKDEFSGVSPLTEEQDGEIRTLVLSVDNLFPKIDAVQKSLAFAEQALPELAVRVRDHMINATLDSIRLPSMSESSVSSGGSLFSSSLIPSYNEL